MKSEQQYIDLYRQAQQMIKGHSASCMNAVRDKAFEDFQRLGFPQGQERYKYTDISKLFEPDYGLNLNRLDIPVDPYEAFRCDVPNLSTSLYFVLILAALVGLNLNGRPCAGVFKLNLRTHRPAFTEVVA